MNYLQRFSKAIRGFAGGPPKVQDVQQVRHSTAPDEWLGRIHDIARSLPPRRVGDPADGT